MDEQKTKKVSQEDWERKSFELWGTRNWRSWGSWYSWGSPVGLGLFFIEIGIFLWILHLANIIH